MAAASNHPALVAVSPQAPVTNWFIGDDFHHKGAFFILDAFSFYPAMGAGFGLPRPKPVSKGPKTIDIPVHDNYKFYLETGALPAFAKLAGDSVRFWKDLYAHPDYDDWWKARDARNATKKLNPAMLWVGGHFDAEDNWGAGILQAPKQTILERNSTGLSWVRGIMSNGLRVTEHILATFISEVTPHYGISRTLKSHSLTIS
jgi:predicted acyl esterase